MFIHKMINKWRINIKYLGNEGLNHFIIISSNINASLFLPASSLVLKSFTANPRSDSCSDAEESYCFSKNENGVRI